MVLDNEFDPTRVDWKNPGANYLFDHFRARFKRRTGEKRQLKEDLKQRDDGPKRRDEKIMQLEAELKKTSGHTHVSRPEKKARSYNVREFKDHPKPRSKDTGGRRAMTRNTLPVTGHKIADMQYCPSCGGALPDGDQLPTCMMWITATTKASGR